MKGEKPDDLMDGWVEAHHDSSWEICRRLKELDVSCHREPYQPLKICAHSPLAVTQSWSVFRHFTQTRAELISWLEDCWNSSSPQSCSPMEY